MKRANWLKACVLGSVIASGAPVWADNTESMTPSEQAVTVTVNINTADAATMAAQLKGIGPSKAEAIVDYREENGPFKSVDELSNVKGIGARSVDQLRSMISI